MLWHWTARSEPCRVVASNAGQLLFTGIVCAERAQRVARTLLSPVDFQRMGHPHRRLFGGPLQSDVVPQRLRCGRTTTG